MLRSKTQACNYPDIPHFDEILMLLGIFSRAFLRFRFQRLMLDIKVSFYYFFNLFEGGMDGDHNHV
jgi:hypothetical protein